MTTCRWANRSGGRRRRFRRPGSTPRPRDPRRWSPIATDSIVPEAAPSPDDSPIPAIPDIPAAAAPLWPDRGSVPATPSSPTADEPLWPTAGHPPEVPPSAGLAGSAGAAPGGAVGIEGWVAAPPAARTGRRFPRSLVIGVVVIVAVVVAGLIGRDSSSGNVSDLHVGDCFDDPIAAGGSGNEVQDVQHHPCSEAHQFEVFASFEFPGDKGAAFPGDSGFDAFVNEQCDPAFTSFVGIPETDSSLTWAAYQPLEAGWDAGDREITCFLQERDLAVLTGSAKGTHR